MKINEMNSLGLLEMFRDVENKIFKTLKVASLARVVNNTSVGHRVLLLPKIDGRDIYVNTLNALKNLNVNDVIVVLFLDVQTANLNIEQLAIADNSTKHSYSAAIALMKVQNLESIAAEETRNEI